MHNWFSSLETSKTWFIGVNYCTEHWSYCIGLHPIPFIFFPSAKAQILFEMLQRNRRKVGTFQLPGRLYGLKWAARPWHLAGPRASLQKYAIDTAKKNTDKFTMTQSYEVHMLHLKNDVRSSGNMLWRFCQHWDCSVETLLLSLSSWETHSSGFFSKEQGHLHTEWSAAGGSQLMRHNGSVGGKTHRSVLRTLTEMVTRKGSEPRAGEEVQLGWKACQDVGSLNWHGRNEWDWRKTKR